MCRHKPLSVLLAFALLFTQSGCWSSKEIEDLSIYTGLTLDQGDPDAVERAFDREGGDYFKNNRVTATVQIVPKKIFSSANESSDNVQTSHYINVSETGDSLFEIFRQFSIRLDRPIIGHHLKVIVIGSKLAEQQDMRKLMDFVLRDNDIRPSCLIFLSRGKASNVLVTKYADEIPSVHIREMIRNRFRTSKVMESVTLSQLDALMYSKKSFLLQNILETQGELEFSGGGIIKGETGKWIGTLNQQDLESISWFKGEVKGGVIKTYNEDKEPITYEIKSASSKITAKITADGRLSFHVDIQSDGRLIENWNPEQKSSGISFLRELESLFEQRLTAMLQHLLQSMQTEYKVEVAGFGEWLSIEKPQVWKKVKEHWDDTFTRVPVTFDVKFTITDFGSATE
ncbi:Ger(x)C family spore germination protein [Paenibacillus sp. S150]|uniref:Ger(x)C family spore germination protein n=1 Tax=Paenibacillus sp. S150 TaxID=2749826 RepID=UPI001C57CC3D|nr:Ger(x)C family spore germination protein [Paenibacillus sp. S150]MBW4080664.1 Ger(x)C family spore germination protein [Paenibacillus sp. S150]